MSRPSPGDAPAGLVYPILLFGRDVRALVVGGGPVAERKVTALLASGAHVRVVAPRVSPAMERLASDSSSVEILRREPCTDDYAGITLVIAATGDRTVNATLASVARERGLPVNVVDAPDEGTFITPAVHRAGDLTIAVSAGGVPAAAARIRDEIGRRFDARYARAVRALRGLRRASLDGRDGDAGDDAIDWPAAASTLLDERFCARVESGELEREAAEWR